MPSHDYLFEDPAESSTSSSRHAHRAPKLKMKLKETDTERTEREWRKEQKRLRKETKRVYRANGISPLAGLATTPPRDADRDQSITPPRKRRRSNEDVGDENDRPRHTYGYDPNVNGKLSEWDEEVWQPQPTGFEKLKATAATAAEEEAWRQKMFDLMEDEEGPNPFVSGRYYSPPRPPSPSLAESPPQQRIPRRFKPPEGDVPPNFSMMDEEEYAEAIRYGMWRRQNKDEVERLERLKKVEEEEERKRAKGKEAQEREEKKRIEVLKREKGVQETKRIQRELAEYKDKWEALRASVTTNGGESDGGKTLRMVDLPWPIFHGSSFHVFAPSLLSAEKIRAFYTAMIPPSSDTTTNLATSSIDEDRAALKKILREAILAYHPDRFVGRYLAKVDEAEREMVKDAVIRTSQIINEIAADNK
ncbi:hypothetical protein QFC21_003460 [Naganishia friedmannii]|uniref:Uncharacterized protein n=1 Tax=Naganishia friedmannii TaxID=89922 RepID=A0ACC2VQ36_9TREE|nr:hypothetical protein QFC21_003460 [Naganishia friedmannii]